MSKAVTASFVDVNDASSEVLIEPGNSVRWEVDGTFVGTVRIEQSRTHGQTWERAQASGGDRGPSVADIVGAGESNAAGVITNEYNETVRYRARYVADTSGTAVVAITAFEEGAEHFKELESLAPNVYIAHHKVSEAGLHYTMLELVDVVVPVTSVTTGNGVGGVTLATFPLGHILRLGCWANLSVRCETEADFTDGTPEGDLGVGTLAPANADALGTDATDDNFATATPFTMAAFKDEAVDLPPENSGIHDGSVSAINLVLTALVDAADIDDGITTNLLVSGHVHLHWTHIGGE